MPKIVLRSQGNVDQLSELQGYGPWSHIQTKTRRKETSHKKEEARAQRASQKCGSGPLPYRRDCLIVFVSRQQLLAFIFFFCDQISFNASSSLAREHSLAIVTFSLFFSSLSSFRGLRE